MTIAPASKSVSISRQAPQGGTTAMSRAVSLRLGVTHRNHALDAAVSLQHGPAECSDLRAHLHAPNRRAQMQPGPNSTVPAAQGRRYHMPHRLVVPRKNRARCLYQRFIGLRERRCTRQRPHIIELPTRRLRALHPRSAAPASCPRPRPPARGFASRSPPPPPCCRAGTAWRSRGPGRCADCRS